MGLYENEWGNIPFQMAISLKIMARMVLNSLEYQLPHLPPSERGGEPVTAHLFKKQQNLKKSVVF